MRGQYIPFTNDPLLYAMGPGHLFFGQAGVPSPTPAPTPILPPQSSPLQNPMTPNVVFGSPLENHNPSSMPHETFENPNISYNPAWGTIGLALASMIGGPIAAGLLGAGMGANMAQEIAHEYGSRGLAPPSDVPQTAWDGALAGAARGALGTLGALAGLTPGWSSLTEAYAAIPSIQSANDWGGLVNTIAENPNGVLGGYTVAGLAPEELGGMGTFGGWGNSWGEGVGATVSGDGLASDPGKGDGVADGGSKGDFGGGEFGYNQGGLVGLAGGGKIAVGPGGGLDDLIPTTIEGRRAARLSDGEFVIPADVVSMLGDGSTAEGSRRLYTLIKNVRRLKTGTTKQAGPINFGGILERILS